MSSRVPWPSPSSRLTELRIGRPPSHCSAVSATGPSVVSTMIGTLDWVASRLTSSLHVGDAVGARVVDADVDDVRALLHLVPGHGHAGVPVAVAASPRGTAWSRWRWSARRRRGTRCPGGTARPSRSRRPRARASGAARPGPPRAALDDRGQVRRGGPAAPADRAHAELGDEAVVVLGQLVGGEVVVHRPVDHRGQPGVGQAGDRHACCWPTGSGGARPSRPGRWRS